jgi:hypothetical protein
VEALARSLHIKSLRSEKEKGKEELETEQTNSYQQSFSSLLLLFSGFAKLL